MGRTATVYLDNPDRHTEFVHQGSFGVERQLRDDLSVSVDYVHVAGRDLLMYKDLNPGLRPTTSRTAPLIRVDPEFVRAVYTMQNLGRTDYDSVQVQVEKRFSMGYSLRGSYTLSYGRGNTTGSGTPTSGFQLLDDMRLDLNEGPVANDRRHNLVVSGTAQVPRTGGLTVSFVARALSGLPFTLTDSSSDPDRNGSFSEPLPSGSYSGSGEGAIDVDFESKRGGARGPGFFEVDTRIGYRLQLGSGRTLDLFGEVFNVTNRANFASPSGDQRSTNFLVLTALREGGIPRTGQIGIRFGF